MVFFRNLSSNAQRQKIWLDCDNNLQQERYEGGVVQSIKSSCRFSVPPSASGVQMCPQLSDINYSLYQMNYSLTKLDLGLRGNEKAPIKLWIC